MAIVEPRSEMKAKKAGIQASVKHILRNYAEALAIAVILALIFRFFVVEAFKIPTGSMVPTLKTGDFILAYKLPYGLQVPFSNKKIGMGWPHRGDVVVFRCPKSPTTKCIKRVVGLPGDRIQMVKKRLKINGRGARYKKGQQESVRDLPGHQYYAVVEEAVGRQKHQILIGRDRTNENFGPVMVPPGHFFVLGDNRDSSDDSRFWGSIPVADLEGQAILIWFSLDWQKVRSGAAWPGVRWERLLRPIY